MRLTSRHPTLLTATLLCTALAACGGSSSSSSTTATGSTTGSTTATSPAQSTTSASSSVTTGPVRGTLHGTGHTPIAGRPWAYSVHVTDASGTPLSGTVAIEFAFNGSVVGRDTPPTHAVTNGHWADKLTFPDTAIGYPLSFQAVVHTSAGSITLDWPVQVKP
jgi:hypothetical protein